MEEKLHNIICDECKKSIEIRKRYAGGTSHSKHWFRVIAPHRDAANFAAREYFDFCSSKCMTDFGKRNGWIENITPKNTRSCTMKWPFVCTLPKHTQKNAGYTRRS